MEWHRREYRKGETIDESMEREILEETGLKVRGMSFRGIVTWNETGGMYVYRAEDTGEGYLPVMKGTCLEAISMGYGGK